MPLLGSNEATPSTPDAGYTAVFINSSKRLSTVDDAALVRVLVDRDSGETLTNKTLTSPILNTPTTTGEVFAAVTATVAPRTDASGTLLTVAALGAHEFDGAAFYQTIDATSGRAQTDNSQIFRLTADGSAIGAAIADYFGANSAFPFVLNSIYLLEFWLFYLKTTAGTVTYTLTNTQTYTNLDAEYFQSAAAGITPNAASTTAGVNKQTTAATALPATASLTTAVEHFCYLKAIAEMGTAGNVRLRVTSSAGTITPRRGSFYKATRLSGANVGTFVA